LFARKPDPERANTCTIRALFKAVKCRPVPVPTTRTRVSRRRRSRIPYTGRRCVPART